MIEAYGKLIKNIDERFTNNPYYKLYNVEGISEIVSPMIIDYDSAVGRRHYLSSGDPEYYDSENVNYDEQSEQSEQSDHGEQSKQNEEFEHYMKFKGDEIDDSAPTLNNNKLKELADRVAKGEFESSGVDVETVDEDEEKIEPDESDASEKGAQPVELPPLDDEKLKTERNRLLNEIKRTKGLVVREHKIVKDISYARDIDIITSKDIIVHSDYRDLYELVMARSPENELTATELQEGYILCGKTNNSTGKPLVFDFTALKDGKNTVTIQQAGGPTITEEINPIALRLLTVSGQQLAQIEGITKGNKAYKAMENLIVEASNPKGGEKSKKIREGIVQYTKYLRWAGLELNNHKTKAIANSEDIFEEADEQVKLLKKHFINKISKQKREAEAEAIRLAENRTIEDELRRKITTGDYKDGEAEPGTYIIINKNGPHRITTDDLKHPPSFVKDILTQYALDRHKLTMLDLKKKVRESAKPVSKGGIGTPKKYLVKSDSKAKDNNWIWGNSEAAKNFREFVGFETPEEIGKLLLDRFEASEYVNSFSSIDKKFLLYKYPEKPGAVRDELLDEMVENSKSLAKKPKK